MRPETPTYFDVQAISPDLIDIGTRKRELQEDKIGPLMESIQTLGQQVPIAVTRRGERLALVAGLHRLIACSRLKEAVVARVFRDEEKARLWEISENLHRAELTLEERRDHLAAWLALRGSSNASTDSSDVKSHEAGGRGNRGGVRQMARELGIPEPTLRRDLKAIETRVAPPGKVDDYDPTARTARVGVEHDENLDGKRLKGDNVDPECLTQVPGQLSDSQRADLNEMKKVCFLDHYSNHLLTPNHQITVDKVRFLQMTPVEWFRMPEELRYFCGMGETTRQWRAELRDFEQIVGNLSLKAAYRARFRRIASQRPRDQGDG